MIPEFVPSPAVRWLISIALVTVGLALIHRGMADGNPWEWVEVVE